MLVALAVAAGACSGDGAAGVGADPVVVATTSIWADVVENVACEGQLSVETLIPIGGDPHAFEPSLSDRARLESAALIVANGLALEEGLEDTLDAVESAGIPVIHLAEVLPDPLRYHAAEDGEGHGHDGLDPHVWFDPVRVGALLPELGDAMADATGVDRTAFDECVSNYRVELANLDAEIAAMVATVRTADRKLVTSHETFGYFADRYGFEVIGTIIPAPSGLAETSPAQLERLALLIESEGVRAIFTEEQHSADDAKALAAQVGPVEVVTLRTGSLGPPDSEARTYTGLLRSTAASITAALRAGEGTAADG